MEKPYRSAGACQGGGGLRFRKLRKNRLMQMTDATPPQGDQAPKKRRLGPAGYVKAMIIARTAAVSWPEAKEMARKKDSELQGPVDIVKDSERRPEERNRP